MAPVRKRHDPVILMEVVQYINSNMMSLRDASRKYGIPRSTLQDKVHNRTSIQPKVRTWLPPKDEEKIAEWMKKSNRMGCCQTKERIAAAVHTTLQTEERHTKFKDDKPGASWCASFLARHPDISLRKTKPSDTARARVTPDSIKQWFAECEATLREDGIEISKIPPECIFNCNVIGFALQSPDSVVLTEATSKHPYEFGNNRLQQQITVLSCASAAGQLLPPTVVFPGKRWTFKPQLDFPEASVALTPKGWITEETYMTWFRERFLPEVENLPRPVVLFIDEHSNYYSLEIHKLCVEHRIAPYVLQSHSFYNIQPLNFIFHLELKREWKKAQDALKAIQRGAEIGVTKFNFMKVFKDAWGRAFVAEEVKRAFEMSCLYPWNPEGLDYSKCETSQVFRPKETQEVTLVPEASHVSSQWQVRELHELGIAPSQPEPSISTASTSHEEDQHLPAPTQDLILEELQDDEIYELATSSQPPLDGLIIKEPQNDPHDSPSMLQFPVQPQLITKPQTIEPEECTMLSGCISCPTCATEIDIRPQSCQWLMIVDELMDLVVEEKWSKSDLWTLRRKIFMKDLPKQDEDSYAKFDKLYKSLTLTFSFDTLPTPAGASDKKRRKKAVRESSYKGPEN